MSLLSDTTCPASDSLIFPRQVGGDKRGHRHASSIVKNRCEKSSSIPSKFSTTLFDRSKISGFMSSAGRFSDNSYMEDPSPGPGLYNQGPKGNILSASPSYSKKGYGNMASVCEKKIGYQDMNRGPGPGSYDYAATMSTNMT